MSQGISGVGTGAVAMGIERFSRIASMQKNAVKEAGQQTLKLIQSASILPSDQGNNLDVSA